MGEQMKKKRGVQKHTGGWAKLHYGNKGLFHQRTGTTQCLNHAVVTGEGEPSGTSATDEMAQMCFNKYS